MSSHLSTEDTMTQLSTPEARLIAAELSHALTQLADLDRLSPMDAELLWTSLVSHLRAARPQALLALAELP